MMNKEAFAKTELLCFHIDFITALCLALKIWRFKKEHVPLHRKP